MVEAASIKAHMAVVDAAGQHVGTVDSVEGDFIKLTRGDASDARHHYLDIDAVAHVDEAGVHLEPGVPLPEGAQDPDAELSADAIAAGYEGQGTPTRPVAEQPPLFGTSGHGTGMGGGGTS
jgi:hypothetical protein